MVDIRATAGTNPIPAHRQHRLHIRSRDLLMHAALDLLQPSGHPVRGARPRAAAQTPAEAAHACAFAATPSRRASSSPPKILASALRDPTAHGLSRPCHVCRLALQVYSTGQSRYSLADGLCTSKG